MYRQIVVPLDGSTFAEAALPLAQGLSRMTGAGLHLVSVVEPTQASGWAERERASKSGPRIFRASASASPGTPVER